MRRLTNKVSRRSLTNPIFENLTYTYDAVGNISSIQNSANPVAGLGGNFTHNYQYDKDNRLINANGNTNIMVPDPNSSNSTNTNFQYNQDYTYSPSGRILSQNVSSNSSSFINGSISSLARSWTYGYGHANNPILQPNTLRAIVGTGIAAITNSYDLNGNLSVSVAQGQGQRIHCWDEENRLHGTRDTNYLTYQAYDASGNRFLKVGLERNLTQQNASTTLAYDQKTITLYISQDMTAQRNRYHKHIFAGSERIATKVGGGIPPAYLPPNDQDSLSPQIIPVATQSTTAPPAATDSTWDNFLHQTASCLGVQRQNLTLDFTLVSLQEKVPTTETQVYYYHTDHLGSTGFLSATLSTTGGARLVQHYQYLPFGENFIHQKGTSHSYHNPYEFNGKEKDLETGYNYYGARHYNSSWGVWLSVDPLADKYPSHSPYNYCMNNPVMLVDPDGRKIYVSGVGSKDYVKQLQSRTKMKVIMGDMGNITFEGKARNKFDKALVKASTNSEFDLRIVTTFKSKTLDGEGADFVGGAFLGANYNPETGKIDVHQLINTNVTNTIDILSKNKGLGVGHETIEAYLIGDYMSKNCINETSFSTKDNENSIYKNAHDGTKNFRVSIEDYAEIQSANKDHKYALYPNKVKISTRGKVYLVDRSSGAFEQMKGEN